jgi:polyhydroxybutyrate depolymerase
MKRVLLLVLISVACGSAAQADVRRLSVNGVKRTYHLHVPAGLPSGAPLVIMLHGAGADGQTALRDYGWTGQADMSRFVLAAPNASAIYADRSPGPKNMRVWNSGPAGIYPETIAKSDDVGFITAMIDDIMQNVGIDLRRVYVAGFSSGGYLANRIGQEIPKRVAAISTSASDLTLLGASPSRGVPVLFSAGDSDPITPIESGRVTAIWGGISFIKPSQRTLVDRWRTLNECPAGQAIPAPANVRIEVSGPCRDSSEVRYILMRGVGHQWPTKDPIDLTQASWDFFKRFSLSASPEGR